MTRYWCDNDQCRYHTACTPSQYYQPHFQTYDPPVYKFTLTLDPVSMEDEKVTVTRVNRHRFIDHHQCEEYFLCDTCATVLQSSDPKFDPDLTK